ncbi:unnamed protein product [Polarella glacialis]|uniref:Uncharacterized protein n=1 Tax=Polarella glacialis TaxID=89957 RepID=A0A813G4A1_POLGL|nr:unnamed protein product [Polarella glacialis]
MASKAGCRQFASLQAFSTYFKETICCYAARAEGIYKLTHRHSMAVTRYAHGKTMFTRSAWHQSNQSAIHSHGATRKKTTLHDSNRNRVYGIRMFRLALYSSHAARCCCCCCCCCVVVC